MKPPLPRTLSAVPQTLHARLEIAKAIRTLAGPDEDELLRQRRAEIAVIRRGLEALSRDIRKFREECLVLARAELWAALKKYSPDQLRVPAGNREGGQWTTDERSGGSISNSSDATGDESGTPKQYAARDAGTLTDETKGRGSTASAATDSSNDRVELAQLKVTPRDLAFPVRQEEIR